jgi:hypothetical protein
VIISFLILVAYVRELRLLTIGGFIAGLVSFTRGLRLRRKEQGSQSAGSTPGTLTTLSAAEASNSAQELIRLSTETVPTKSADMTQQQKIAAALARAGISNSAWMRQSSELAVQTLEKPEESDSAAPPALSGEVTDHFPKPSNRRGNLLVWCGLVLAVVSLVLLAIIH